MSMFRVDASGDAILGLTRPGKALATIFAASVLRLFLLLVLQQSKIVKSLVPLHQTQ